MGSAIDQILRMQDTAILVVYATESSFNSARGPCIIQRRPTDPNGRFSVRLAQRQYMLVIPRLTDFDRIRRQPVHDSRLTRIPA